MPPVGLTDNATPAGLLGDPLSMFPDAPASAHGTFGYADNTVHPSLSAENILSAATDMGCLDANLKDLMDIGSLVEPSGADCGNVLADSLDPFEAIDPSIRGLFTHVPSAPLSPPYSPSSTEGGASSDDGGSGGSGGSGVRYHQPPTVPDSGSLGEPMAVDQKPIAQHAADGSVTFAPPAMGFPPPPTVDMRLVPGNVRSSPAGGPLKMELELDPGMATMPRAPLAPAVPPSPPQGSPSAARSPPAAVVPSSTGAGRKRSASDSTTNAMAAGSPGETGLSEQALRKQRRMMKNRESACLSRRKKKEYVDKLEKLVAEGDADRTALRGRVDELERENEALKKRLKAVDSVVDEMPSVRAAIQAKISGASSPAKAGASCLMAVLFCVALFRVPADLAPVTSPAHVGGEVFAPRNGALGMSSYRPVFHGRTLQSVGAASSPLTASQRTALHRSSSALAVGGESRPAVVPPRTSPATTRGPAQPQLDQWMRQHKELLAAHLDDTEAARYARQKAEAMRMDAAESGSALSTHVVAPAAKPVTAQAGGTPMHQEDASYSAPPFFRIEDDLRPQLFHSVRQRDDTSYIFCTEVQVASAPNPETGKPLLSLVMPTPQNGSTSRLVQIDCDVRASRFIYHHNMTDGGSALRPV